MSRLILTCLGILLLGADPAPAPKLAPAYTLRFEEKGVEIERRVPAGQKPVDLSTEEDTLIVTTDVEITPGQPFRVRMKQGNQIRIVSGRPAAALNDQGRLPVEIVYAIIKEHPGDPPDRTSARTTVTLPSGEPLTIGGMITSAVGTKPEGNTQNYKRLVISVALLEKTKDELDE